MSRWASYGYAPVGDPNARHVEDWFLVEHFPTVHANIDRIVETPRYFFCQLRSAWLSAPFVFGGGGPIPLGVLALLWRVGEMIYDCPICGERFFAVGACGSVLSGCGSVWGVCLHCRKRRFSRRQCGSSIIAVGELLAVHRNEAVIAKGKQPRFDWAEGLMGESSPDRVIVPAITALDLERLVREILAFPESEGRSEATAQ